MVLAFIPEATDGVDRAMDALSSSDEMPADVYFVINDDEYLINAVNLIWTKKFNKNTDTAKITVKGIVNFTGTNAVYLHDKTTDLYHDIKNSFYDLTLPGSKQYPFRNNF
jgi:hypothetical protein